MTEIRFENGEVTRRRPRTPQDDAGVDAWIAEMTGLQVDTDSATLHAALGEVINEHLHPTPDPQPEPIEVFTLPEASNSEPKPPAVLASDGPGVVVDRAALEMLRQRATASDRTMLAIGKLVGITATDEQTVVAAVTEALAEVAADGTELVDSAELAALRGDAERWRGHRWDSLLDAAVRDGRITTYASEPGWRIWRWIRRVPRRSWPAWRRTPSRSPRSATAAARTTCSVTTTTATTPPRTRRR